MKSYPTQCLTVKFRLYKSIPAWQNTPTGKKSAIVPALESNSRPFAQDALTTMPPAPTNTP